MKVVTSLILAWFILRDWPKVYNNVVELRRIANRIKADRHWRKLHG